VIPVVGALCGAPSLTFRPEIEVAKIAEVGLVVGFNK
jgi:hypothetical protein